MVKDLQGLIRIPSLRDLNTKAENAPFGKELRNALDYVLDMATKDGFKWEMDEEITKGSLIVHNGIKQNK